MAFFTTDTQNEGILPTMVFMDWKFCLGGSVGITINDEIWALLPKKRILGKETPYHLSYSTLW